MRQRKGNCLRQWTSCLPWIKRVKDLAKAPVMVDLRNIYNPDDMRAAGFTYVSVGRA